MDHAFRSFALEFFRLLSAQISDVSASWLFLQFLTLPAAVADHALRKLNRLQCQEFDNQD